MKGHDLSGLGKDYGLDLSHAFASQVEALKRYRTGGEQTVRVEHVTVNEGGQAIVGAVTHGGRGSLENPEPSP